MCILYVSWILKKNTVILLWFKIPSSVILYIVNYKFEKKSELVHNSSKKRDCERCHDSRAFCKNDL